MGNKNKTISDCLPPVSPLQGIWETNPEQACPNYRGTSKSHSQNNV